MENYAGQNENTIRVLKNEAHAMKREIVELNELLKNTNLEWNKVISDRDKFIDELVELREVNEKLSNELTQTESYYSYECSQVEKLKSELVNMKEENESLERQLEERNVSIQAVEQIKPQQQRIEQLEEGIKKIRSIHHSDISSSSIMDKLKQLLNNK